MTQVINQIELFSNEIGHEFEGTKYGDTNVCFILIDAAPGTGPKLHSHPYKEIFIIQEGEATFTVDGTTIHATAGQIVIAGPNTAHKFINSGTGPLRQVDIHTSPRFITQWLEE